MQVDFVLKISTLWRVLVISSQYRSAAALLGYFYVMISCLFVCSRFVPYIGIVTILMNDYPKFKVSLPYHVCDLKCSALGSRVQLSSTY